jgi:endonuclease/exonuclease/phosphatase family metal-dependent hydrolase
METSSLRIASYNIHQGFGLDFRMKTERIGEVLQALNADLIGLQEVYQPQAVTLAAQLGYSFHMVGTEERRRGMYGNAILSRQEPLGVRRFSLAQEGKEPRAGVWVTFSLGGQRVHFLNVHLGLSEKERAAQASHLISKVLPIEVGPKILVGDLNEWRDREATALLASAFSFSNAPKTFPAFLPLIKLDRLYWDAPLQSKSIEVWRKNQASFASDHAPLVAEFTI